MISQRLIGMQGKSDRLRIRRKSDLEIKLKLSAAEPAKELILKSS